MKALEDKDKETVATFKVSENVLPKFEVTLKTPDFVLFDTEEENFKVCGVYTHGGKVKGTANVTFYSEFRQNYWRAPLQRIDIVKKQELENGCAALKLNNTEIKTLASKGPIKIFAVVKERVTATQQNITESITVQNTAVEIKV